jgi:hypothetical protein
MDRRVNPVTLGVADAGRADAFCEAPGGGGRLADVRDPDGHARACAQVPMFTLDRHGTHSGPSAG